MTLGKFITSHRKAPNQVQTHTWFPSERDAKVTLHVPEDKKETLFHDLFAQVTKKDTNLDNGINALSEKVPLDAPFRLFVDLDFKTSHVSHLSLKEIETAMKGIIRDYVETLATLIKQNRADIRVVIARRLPYKVHLHFPDIVVSSAKDARYISDEFEKKFQKNPLYHTDVLDKSVYRTGLRMLWCNKGSLAKPKRSEADKKEHETVFGQGTFRNVYEVVDSDFQATRWRREDLNNTSIFAPKDSKPVILSKVSATRKTVKNKPNAKAIPSSSESPVDVDVTQDPDDAATHLRHWLSAEFSLTDENNILLEQSKPGGAGYERKGKQPLVKDTVIIPTRDRACPFKNGEHRTNHVYFLLRDESIELRCHDEDCANQLRKVTLLDMPQDVSVTLQQLRNRILTRDVTSGLIGKELSTLRKKYPNNEFELDPSQAIIEESGATFMLRDLYCIKCEKYHEDPQTWLECTNAGEIMLRCIRNLISPKLSLMNLSSNVTNILFQGNNNVINVNCPQDDGKSDVRDFGRIVDFPKLHSDSKLDLLCFESLIMGRTDDIAAYVEESIKGKYAFIDEVWYHYTGTHWKAGVTPRAYLTQDISKTYAALREVYDSEKQIRWLNAIIEDLGNSNRRRHIMADLEQRLRESEHQPLPINSKPYLLGFHNGVFDSRNGSFREHRQDDYITFLLPHSLPETSDPHLRNEINIFFENLMPSKGVRDFLLLTLSLALEGKNSHQICTIWTGCGSNGKSQLKSFLQLVYTDTLFASPLATFLTNDVPDAQKPAPHIIDLANKRVLFCSEPEDGKKANGAFIKFLSGGDQISARKCGGNKIMTFLPQFVPTLLCNGIPLFSGAQVDTNGLWRRVKIVPFSTVFSAAPNLNCPEQRMIDMDLGTKMERWPAEFLLMLVEIYRSHLASGRVLNEPTEVKATLQEQKNENNPFPSWFHQTIEQTADAEKRIHLHRIAEMYQDYLRAENNNPNMRGVSTKDITKQLKALSVTFDEQRHRVLPECETCNTTAKALVGWCVKV